MTTVKIRNYVAKHLFQPLLVILKTGATPDKLAHAIALGAIMGIFPLFGTTTITCILLASLFRLNHVAVQLVNYAMYPIQVLLIFPLYRFGMFLTGSMISTDRLEQILEQLLEKPWNTIIAVGDILWAGVIGWSTIAVPTYLVVFSMALKFLRKANPIIEKAN